MGTLYSKLRTCSAWMIAIAASVPTSGVASPPDSEPPKPEAAQPQAVEPEAAQPQAAKPEAAPAPEVTVPLNLALIARVSVNRLSGRNVHNFVSLGLISHESSRLTGLQLGLGASGVDGNVVGVQIGGLVSGAGRSINGIQAGGLVSGNGRSVRGVQLGGLVSGAGRDIRGAQLSFLVSGAGGEVAGVQLGGLVSGAGGEVAGVQLGGLVSGAGGRVSGVQLSGLVSGAPEVSGAQLSVLFNGAGHYRGLQLAGVMNAAGQGSGLQLAVGANYAKQALRGVQVGLVNVGRVVRGAQIGLVNVACHVHGAQVGLVNVSSTANGILIGPFSYVDAARKNIEVWTSPTSPVALAWRLGRDNVYSLLIAGAHPFADSPRLSLGAGIGVESGLGGAWSVEPDAVLGYVLYDYELSGTDAWLAQLRGKVIYRLRPALALFAGVSLNAAVSDETDAEELAPALDAAFESGDTVLRIWPGLFAGVRL